MSETPKKKVRLTYLTDGTPIFDIDPDTTSKNCMEKDSNNPRGNILYDNAKLPPGNMRETLGLGIMVNGTIGYIELTPTKITE